MNTFQSMTLAEPIKKALDELQFTSPTPIQDSVIPLALSGKDVMACAETGSGKTGAFSIPTVSRLLESPNSNALILAPTRELAQQIHDFIKTLTKYCSGFNTACLLGGSDMQRQYRALKKNPRVIVATPGRLNDHLMRKSVSLKDTDILILDEGDRMLDMGFAPQLAAIAKHLPKKRQTSLFTATLPKKVQELAQIYLHKPERVGTEYVSKPVSKIKQSIIEVEEGLKLDKLIDELNARSGAIVVFTRTKRTSNKIWYELKDLGFDADVIHGDRTQGQRNKAIKNFKTGKSRILVATDIAARGIDIPAVEHVINYDLPTMIEDYVHRVGRTARNGADGNALNFITPSDHRAWKMIAKKYKIPNVELKGQASVQQGPQRNRKASQKKGKTKSSGKGYSKSRSQSTKSSSSKKNDGKKSFGKKKASGSKKSSAKKSSTNKKSSAKRSSSKKFSKSGSSKKGGKKFGSKRFSKKKGQRR